MSSVALPLRVFEYWLLQYRRVWRGTAITSVVNPVFYLGALGVGLGTLVNKSAGASLGVSYIDFVAPGMLAATAMTIASGEASWPVMGSIKWTRQYYAMLATPIGTRDIVLGHQLWMTARVASTSVVYLAVIAAFGGVNSPLGILALPAAVLLGAAFTTPFAAYAATRENEAAFVPVNRFVVVPMFLFSGTSSRSHGCRYRSSGSPTRHRCGTASSSVACSLSDTYTCWQRSDTWRISCSSS